METTKNRSEVSVFCEDECGPIPCCRVVLRDAGGRILSEGDADKHGRAVLPFCGSGVCEVSASAGEWRSPRLQSRRVRLCGGRNAALCFLFNLPPCPSAQCPPPAGSGTLRIRLGDAFYPQYALSEGVYSLWRSF